MTRHTVMPRSFYYPKDAKPFPCEGTDAEIWIYTSRRSGKLGAVGFHGRAQKPDFHYTFNKPEALARYLKDYLDGRRYHVARELERREQAKAFQHKVRVGDIFRTCWGYDQTNVEFFQVVEIKGKHAILREVACASETIGGGADRVVPQTGAFLEPTTDNPAFAGYDRGRPIRRLIQDGRIRIDHVRTASPWGERDPITGTVIGPACHATSAGWGH